MSNGEAGTVSVIIGAYNAARWIGKALDSVLGQTYPVLEVLVVDDGSTDATPTIIQAYGGKVRYLAAAHGGWPHRNRGILDSRGDFVAFIDADDYWQPRKIEKQMRLLRAERTQWVICDTQWLDDATGTLGAPIGAAVRGGDILRALFLHNFIVASTPLICRRALDSVGLFNETTDALPCEDWDLWLRLAAKYPVSCVSEAEAVLRLHEDSLLSSTSIALAVRSQVQIIARAAEREAPRVGALRRQALYNVYHAAGIRLFRRRHLREARTFLLRAWLQQPFRLEDMALCALSLAGRNAPDWVARLRGKDTQHA